MLIIVISITIAGLNLYKIATCDTKASEDLLKELCHLYKTNQIAGSMCQAICDEKRLTFEKCTNYRRGKRVMFMQCQGCEPERKTRVVLKTKSALEDREVFDLPKSEKGELYSGWFEVSKEVIVETVKSYFAVNLSHINDIYSFLWGEDFENYVNTAKVPNARYVAVQTIWALTQQLEYTFNVLYKDRSFVPKIYGTCGPVYISEFTSSVANLEFGFTSLLGSWNFRGRAKVALEIMKLLKVLEYDLHQPLHLCDVKGDNFGTRENGEITLVDTDCATFHEPLYTSFFTSNCSKHRDCDFFDCHGYCDGLTGKCLQTRTNNNLQSVCADVFIGGFSRFATGLLREPPRSIQLKLNKALHECAYPGLHNDKYVRRPAPDESWDEIVNILKEYLEVK